MAEGELLVLKDREGKLIGKPSNKIVGLRQIKMVRPICGICQHEPEVPRDWWRRCDHDDVYFHPDDRVEGGQSPNLTQVAVNARHRGGQLPDDMARDGFMLPEQLGVAPFCQMTNCWVQNPQHRTAWGDFCREREIKEVIIDVTEETKEVANPRFVRRQLARINTGV